VIPLVGDFALFRGGYYRVLSVVPGRWDIPDVDPGDVEGENEYGDIDLFGFNDIEEIVHPHEFSPSAPNHILCDQCLCYEAATWHRGKGVRR
jgi:hypothetical protein